MSTRATVGVAVIVAWGLLAASACSSRADLPVVHAPGWPPTIQTCGLPPVPPWARAPAHHASGGIGRYPVLARARFGSDRLGAIWVAAGPDGEPTIYVPLVEPTTADRWAAEALRHLAAAELSVEVVAAPRSTEDLARLRTNVVARARRLLGRSVPSVTRSDTGQVVVTLRPGEEDQARRLIEDSPPCSVQITFGSPQANGSLGSVASSAARSVAVVAPGTGAGGTGGSDPPA